MFDRPATPAFARTLRLVAMTWGFAVFLPLAVSASDAADEALKRIQSQFSGLKSVSASFTQTRELAALAKPLEIKGRMALQKPGRFAWVVEKPIRYALVVEGQTATEWDEESNKSRRISLSQNVVMRTVVQQLQACFSGDYGPMSKEFDVSVVPGSAEALVFKPKRRSPVADFVREIQVVFGRKSGYIESLTIREDGGNKTSIRFSGTRLNKRIPAEIWNAAKSR